MLEQIMKNVNEVKPLVHHITNYVTVNDCANVVLASGGSPIMADDATEVEEITNICNSLVINIGTLNERTVHSMIVAGKKANQLGHPVILDPVGAGASHLRTKTLFRLLEEVRFAVVRGNVSEIKTIATGHGRTKGVDAVAADEVTEESLDEMMHFAKELSRKIDAVIAITGKIDIVADEKQAFAIHNGHPTMSNITGTGCMLTSVIGTFCGANPSEILESTVVAVAAMGLCGEQAHERTVRTDGGTSSFRMHLIDAISKLNQVELGEGIKLETR